LAGVDVSMMTGGGCSGLESFQQQRATILADSRVPFSTRRHSLASLGGVTRVTRRRHSAASLASLGGVTRQRHSKYLRSRSHYICTGTCKHFDSFKTSLLQAHKTSLWCESEGLLHRSAKCSRVAS
jgi:hypothetical protein